MGSGAGAHKEPPPCATVKSTITTVPHAGSSHAHPLVDSAAVDERRELALANPNPNPNHNAFSKPYPPVDGAAVDERRELAQALAEGRPHGRAAQHHVQVLARAVQEVVPHLHLRQWLEGECRWALGLVRCDGGTGGNQASTPKCPPPNQPFAA